MIVMEVDLINAGKRLLTDVLPASGRHDAASAVGNIRTKRERVAKFPIALCRWPSTHNNNVTYIILKLIYRTRLATTFRRLPIK